MFTCWEPDGTLAAISAERRHGPTAWYWSAILGVGRPVLHVTEWEVPLRASAPGVLKAHQLWAEHLCEVPMEQWTVSNECYATALDDPDEALGRAYGTAAPIAIDLEWYATAPPRAIDATDEHGYVQDGVVHGVIEGVPDHPLLTEVPARRWHRWGDHLGPLALPDAYAHADARVVFAFPDHTVADWALTPDGFRSRRSAASSAAG